LVDFPFSEEGVGEGKKRRKRREKERTIRLSGRVPREGEGGEKVIEDEGRRGLRGSQEVVGWRVRVVLRLRSLSFIIIIKFIISSQCNANSDSVDLSPESS
jgi:hypothetical protein